MRSAQQTMNARKLYRALYRAARGKVVGFAAIRWTLPRFTALYRAGSGGKVLEHKSCRNREIERRERVYRLFYPTPIARSVYTRVRTREGGAAKLSGKGGDHAKPDLLELCLLSPRRDRQQRWRVGRMPSAMPDSAADLRRATLRSRSGGVATRLGRRLVWRVRCPQSCAAAVQRSRCSAPMTRWHGSLLSKRQPMAQGTAGWVVFICGEHRTAPGRPRGRGLAGGGPEVPPGLPGRDVGQLWRPGRQTWGKDWCGTPRQGWVRRGTAWRGRGKPWRGEEGSGLGVAWYGKAWPGQAGWGLAGLGHAWQGKPWRFRDRAGPWPRLVSGVWRGTTAHIAARRAEACRGELRRGRVRSGLAWRVMASPGWDWQGAARHDSGIGRGYRPARCPVSRGSRFCQRAVVARHALAGQGMVWLGLARWGRVRSGLAG
jgi:hypothetical protein